MAFARDFSCGGDFPVCLLCVGNQASVDPLVTGQSSSPIGDILVAIFWRAAARRNARWWAEYVNTKVDAAGGVFALRPVV